MWRTPLLPVDELTAWGERLRAPAAVEAAEDPGAAVAADRAALRQRLAVAVDRPEIREALHVAAPRLQRAVGAWLADPADKRGRGVEREGVMNSSVWRGRSLSSAAMASSFAWLGTVKSVRLGRYWRNSPLRFFVSLALPRAVGLAE